MTTTCSHVTSSNVKTVPSANTPVYKDECTLCYQSWDTPEGIYVCMTCFNGGCIKHAKMHYYKRNHPVALNIRRIRKEQPTQDAEEERPQKLTKLAIGVPGGLSLDTEDYFEYQTKPMCFACDKELDPSQQQLQAGITSLMAANSSAKQEDSMAWEHQVAQCEHTLTLQQVDNPPILAAKSLSHCGMCDLSANLWLCMTCGHLGCGRKNFDGTGGNGHGVAHFEKTRHPVVCKLGTITPEGTADLHCYICDDAVLDPYLTEHLGSFGIVVSSQVKTEKSMSELELEQNLNLDLSKAVEGNVEVTKLYGPGYTGLKNLGNTCYMASVLQVMFALPEVQKRYLQPGSQHISNCTNSPPSCYHCQMAKLADGLLSGRYSQPAAEKKEPKEGEEMKEVDDQDGIPPRMLKSLLCKDHPEFKTMKQQDALEFFQFMLKEMQRREKATGEDPTSVFQHTVQQKLQCTVCKGVKYSSVKQTDLSLGIPIEAANPPLDSGPEKEKDSDRAEREGKSTVPFESCLDSFAADEMVSYFCSRCNKQTLAAKHYRFETLPKYLAVHMRRFIFEDWVPRKLAVKLGVPEQLDLSKYRAVPHQPDEVILEEPKKAQEVAPKINQADVEAMMSMGFPRVRCERALFATNNQGSEMATAWLFDHMDDPEIDVPLPKPKSEEESVNIPEDLINSVCEMGFTPAQAKKALKETNLNMERAVDWLFSHSDEPIADEPVQQAPNQDAMEIDTGSSKFRFLGFIVHLGVSTHSGHYIAYLHKDGNWVQFNDRKVSKSVNPPTGTAYLYFFERL